MLSLRGLRGTAETGDRASPEKSSLGPRVHRSRIWIANGILVVLGAVVGIGLTEVALRVTAINPTFGAAHELNWMRHPSAGDRFTVSSEMGFRPKLGTELYSELGTLRNEYDFESRSDRTRLLFMGDSVTARGRIVAALRAVAGDGDYEYWNAGVESFNTFQEIAYYRRFNALLMPDHVILTFHLNDFETTPVVVQEADGSLVVYAPRQPRSRLFPWLFAHSYLYRWWVAWRTPGGDPKAIARELKLELRAFAGALGGDGICFSVVVFPYMKDPAQWSRHQHHQRQLILDVLRTEGIRHFDLMPALHRALADGIDPEESPGDSWHPSQAAADVMAAQLMQEGLLDVRCSRRWH